MSALSTATLCFLFADQMDGYDPAGSGNQFTTETDAPHQFDRAWWVQASLEITMVRLRDLGILELTPETSAHGPGQVVGARGLARPPHLPALDDEIAGRLWDTYVVTAMANVGAKWVLKGTQGWLNPARDEAVRAGMGVSLGHGVLRRLWNGGDAHEWNREAINRHWEEFWHAHEGWRRFRTEDAELAQLLAGDISTGLVEAIPSDGW